MSPVKMKADIVATEKRDCEAVFKKQLIDGQVCVGKKRLVDTCKGDSGGPLMYKTFLNKDFIWFQAGVVSLGYNSPCGVHPAVYTYTPAYLEWIYQTIKP